MEAWFIWLFFIFLIALSVIVGHYQTKAATKRITRYLHARGATNVVVSSVWFDFDKTTNTYDVGYTNRYGEYCQTSCKIQTGFFSDGTLYWQDPP